MSMSILFNILICLLLRIVVVNNANATPLPSSSPSSSSPARQHFLPRRNGDTDVVSRDTFESLEELARIVDIAYCVGNTGIQKPFSCLSFCDEFPGFELVTTWNTGLLTFDSSGYIALSHAPGKERIIVAFRGTYSMANFIADLSTLRSRYVPYLGSGGADEACPPIGTKLRRSSEQVPLGSSMSGIEANSRGEAEAEGSGNDAAAKSDDMFNSALDTATASSNSKTKKQDRCDNCTVHWGFLTSWQDTRCQIVPDIELAIKSHPNYELTLVGHSLGGALATLAGLEFQARGWSPVITTFGEPRLGNTALNDFIDRMFNLTQETNTTGFSRSDTDDHITSRTTTTPNHKIQPLRRVTHISDPVPLLPLESWGYTMHAGEIYISKPSLPPSLSDLHHCTGDQDPECIQNHGPTLSFSSSSSVPAPAVRQWGGDDDDDDDGSMSLSLSLSLFFAHRDYFWRLGLCLKSPVLGPLAVPVPVGVGVGVGTQMQMQMQDM